MITGFTECVETTPKYRIWAYRDQYNDPFIPPRITELSDNGTGTIIRALGDEDKNGAELRVTEVYFKVTSVRKDVGIDY